MGALVLLHLLGLALAKLFFALSRLILLLLLDDAVLGLVAAHGRVASLLVQPLFHDHVQHLRTVLLVLDHEHEHHEGLSASLDIQRGHID